MNRIRMVLGIILVVLVVMGVNIEGVGASVSLPITVEPILPEGQVKGVNGYIHVKTDKQYTGNLRYKVKNVSNKQQEVRVEVVDAYTSPNGVIQYEKEKTDNTDILTDTYKLTEYVKEDRIVTIQPGQTEIVTIEVQTGNMKGTLLGGIVFKAMAEDNTVVDQGRKVTINNEVNLVSRVVVDFEGESEMDLKFGTPFVEPLPTYYILRLPTIMNTEEVKNFEVTYGVWLGEKEVFSGEREYLFAPKTQSNLVIPWESKKIERGKVYTIKGVFQYRDRDGKEQEVLFEKDFKYEQVKDKEGSSFLGVPLEVGGLNYGKYLLLLIVLGVVGAYMRTRRNKKEIMEKDTDIKE